MIQIRVGISNYYPLWTPRSQTIDGILGRFLLEVISSTLNGVNVTFIPVEPPFKSRCFSNGLCTHSLHDLQVGNIDFILPPPLSTLESIGTNLTTGSIESEDGCYLGYKKKLKVNVDYSTFFGFIFELGPWFWLTLLSLLSVFSIILYVALKVQSPSRKMIDIIWIQIECISCQNFNSLLITSNRFRLTLLMIFLLLSSILLTNSLRTGLVSNIEYLKLETLQDAFENSYEPVVQETSQCLSYLIKDTQLTSKLKVLKLQGRGLYDVYQNTREDNVVEINSRPAIKLLKSFGCIYGRGNENLEPYDISSKAIFKLSTVFLINKKNPAKLKLIFKRSYRAFEAGLLYNSIIYQIRMKCFSLDHASLSCLNRDFEIHASQTPITINYLMIPISSLFSMLLALSLIMIPVLFKLQPFRVFNCDKMGIVRWTFFYHKQ